MVCFFEPFLCHLFGGPLGITFRILTGALLHAVELIVQIENVIVGSLVAFGFVFGWFLVRMGPSGVPDVLNWHVFSTSKARLDTLNASWRKAWAAYFCVSLLSTMACINYVCSSLSTCLGWVIFVFYSGLILTLRCIFIRHERSCCDERLLMELVHSSGLMLYFISKRKLWHDPFGLIGALSEIFPQLFYL